MSRVTEVVERDTVLAEAEPDDDEDETEAEPDDEELDDEEEQEARGPTPGDLVRFERENTRHENALAKVIGADWKDFEPCATCDGVGHLPAIANKALPFEHDPQRATCETCKGFGTTMTGARPPGQDTMACSACSGLGWRTLAEQQQVQPLAALPEYTPEAPADNGAPASPVDPRVAALRAEGYLILDRPEVAPPAGS